MRAGGGITAAERARVRVSGTVQGVGFRPFVHGLATELGLAGWVRNDQHGVLCEVEGPGEGVAAFVDRLRGEAPPLAVVEQVRAESLAPTGERGFAIMASARATRGETPPVAPDSATCDDCLRELFDPADRRHRYPFVNCTNCGPRFTIVRDVPYDRALTTMADFAMCAACRAEYDDPGDRRFHAQPNACPACGPCVTLVPGGGAGAGAPPAAAAWAAVQHGFDPVDAAAAALRHGAVVAVKGIGGYHLACRADDEDAVTALRARKHREERPFALMAADLGAARTLVELDGEASALLLGRARPIVLAPRRPGARVAAAVAPRSPELGVMLPYSPLHHLLLASVGAPLVMTSGNVSDEPIAYADDDAGERLAPIADLILRHDRPIETRTDDSVVRSGAVLRRSRGFVPDALALPVPAVRPVLAVGAELKSTFCVARGERAWLSHHVGDLKNWETLASFQAGIAHFERLFSVRPEVVAHDLHPEYLSTGYALARDGVEPIAVQHHHAHLAAVLAEHGETGPAVGAIFDGAGLGTDGSVWGGELLVGDLHGFERAGHLWEVRLPGGDRAVAEPWRMACAWLVAAGEEEPLPLPGVDAERWAAVAGLARTGLASPVTSSAGRLFDAIAALCGVRLVVSYEGQAAIELEAAVDPEERGSYPVGPGLDARPLIRAVAADVLAGVEVGRIAARAHRGIARATAIALAGLASDRGLSSAVLSGGVFQNRVLLALTRETLETAGLRVLVPERLPANDGAISYGQAAVAAARLQAAQEVTPVDG